MAVSKAAVIMKRFKYAGESTFWYFLGRRAVKAAEKRLPEVLDTLNKRALELGLPIEYPEQHARAWAVLCQLFALTHSRTPILGRFSFSQMHLGFARVLGKNFPKIGFQRILGNIESPAFPGRLEEESIADTFLVNGLKLIDESNIDRSMDAIIQKRCLSDELMLLLGKEAVEPPMGLWENTVEEYSKRRPGVLRRRFSNADTWLFDE